MTEWFNRYIPDWAAKLLRRRLENHPPWVVLVELFLALGWLRAAVSKVISPGWFSGDKILEFATEKADLTLPWYEPLIAHVIAPTVQVVALATVVIQLLVAVALLTGVWVPQALMLAIVFNVNVIASGGVDPSIFYLMLQAAVLLWLLDQVSDARRDSLCAFALAAAILTLVLSVPFVRTVDPAHVIEDPGSVLATFGLCVAVAVASRAVPSKAPATQHSSGSHH